MDERWSGSGTWAPRGPVRHSGWSSVWPPTCVAIPHFAPRATPDFLRRYSYHHHHGRHRGLFIEEREGNQTEEDVSPHGVVLHRLSVLFLFIHVRLALSSQLRARRTIRDSVWMIISLPYDVLCNKNKCAKSCFPACNL